MLKQKWAEDAIKCEASSGLGREIAKKQESGFNVPSYKAPSVMGDKPKVYMDKETKQDLQTIIIVPDVHSYARSPSAYELCMQSVKVISDDYNVTKIVQLGDLLECAQFTKHPASSVYDRSPEYSEEVEWAVQDFWTRIKASAPKAKLVHLLGNHEDRANTFIVREMKIKAGAMAQAMYEGIMPTELYKNFGVEIVPYGNEDPRDGMHFITDDLCCVHGWSFATHAAKNHLDKTMGATSIIFGHTHRIQSYVRHNPMTGSAVGAWSFGALAKNNMYYQKGTPNDHSNGFGIVQTDGKYFNIITVPMLKDGSDDIVVLPHGKTLRTRSNG